jgi:hypothetical protein
MSLDVSIAYLKNQYLSPPARAFVEMLKKMISKEPEDQGIRKILDEYLTKWQQGGLQRMKGMKAGADSCNLEGFFTIPSILVRTFPDPSLIRKHFNFS